MPILEKEIDLYPFDLLEIACRGDAVCSFDLGTIEDVDAEPTQWWAMYTRSRHEKQLMRKLHAMNVPFYGPVVERRYRNANGRVRTSYETLFSNYVFVYGSERERYKALTTNCISRVCPVTDGERLANDLLNIQRLIATGAPLTPETRVSPGEHVRVRSGPFAGFEGIVTKRHGETRLLVYVEFMKQGASVLLEDCQLEVV